LEQLEGILVSFSRLIVENPRIKECDINPIIASEKNILALDARILLHGKSVREEELPSLAIRPYPSEYVKEAVLKNGLAVLLRPIYAEDEPLVIEFHRELSELSVRNRFFEFMSFDARTAHERLIRICFNDYGREWAIVAEMESRNRKLIAGIGRLMRIPGINRAQFKLVIRDDYHHLGLGTLLMKHLLHIAQEEKIDGVDGYILSENEGMLSICSKLGFTLRQSGASPIVHVEHKLRNLLP
jgi:acetyltransferase